MANGSIIARGDNLCAIQAAPKGESEAETARRRLECRQAYPAGSARKFFLDPTRQGQRTQQVRTRFQITARQRGGLLGVHRSNVGHSPLRERFKGIAKSATRIAEPLRRRFGYRQQPVLLPRRECLMNHERVYQLYH